MNKEIRMLEAKNLRKSGMKQKNIASALGVSERTIRNYLNGYSCSSTTKNNNNFGSKLAPYMSFIREKINEEPDRNAQLLLEDIQKMGYSGGKTVFYDFTHKIKKETNVKIVIRYETNPGLQSQVDWKEVGWRKYRMAPKSYTPLL
jgi:transposase